VGGCFQILVGLSQCAPLLTSAGEDVTRIELRVGFFKDDVVGLVAGESLDPQTWWDCSLGQDLSNAPRDGA